MSKDTQSLVREVMEFWFLPYGHPERGNIRSIWFEATPEFDAEIRRRFEADLIAAGKGELDGLSATAEGVLTLLILLDQFPRNLYRGQSRAYAYDPKARAVARLATSVGVDKLLAAVERVFVYLPFEHSEDIEDQTRSVASFKTLPMVAWRDDVIDYAIRHHDIIATYGRFPHRNAALGRSSTPQEMALLQSEDSSFLRPGIILGPPS